jgi:ABC-type multidrug transport system fused ATPase/permease subunit
MAARAVAATCALGVTLLSLAIPVLVQRTIDDAVLPGDRALLLRMLLAILALAVVRFVVNSTRRYATAQVGVRSEARLRGLLYAAYLRFPRGFYDRHARGRSSHGHERPVPDPLLHRLGRGPDGHERHDDRRGDRHPAGRRPVPDALRGCAAAPDRGVDVALRATV